MAKVTAVIDIGSNSCRMVVFEKTSRYSFRLLQEVKSKVRISQGAYESDGRLQPEPMQRAVEALSDFLEVASAHKARKILCVATSALRDAPNGKAFVNEAYRQLGLQIKIIGGAKEAYLGGVAAMNLLPKQKRAVTVDIGGGSTELAVIEGTRVLQSHSLDIGTVRLKELFFDAGRSEEGRNYIRQMLDTLALRADTVIAIGGTARAISKSIMKTGDYPLDKLHGFAYDVHAYKDYIEKLLDMGPKKLKKFKIKSDRLDTIGPGSAIFLEVLEHLRAQNVLTSGVGVREGLFLTDLLRRNGHRFPPSFNPSVKNMISKYYGDGEYRAVTRRSARLYALLHERFDPGREYEAILGVAAKLSMVGRYINIYKYNKIGQMMVIEELNYGFSHHEIYTIATLVRYSKNKLPHTPEGAETGLLPAYEVLQYLSFILSLAIKSNDKTKFAYKGDALEVCGDYVVTKELASLQVPKDLDFDYCKD
ncbi:MAG: Ppx/GppA phosphatase family protein [Campylobacterota bacterium]